MIYVFKCRKCDERVEFDTRIVSVAHSCGGTLQRDWRAEQANVWTFTNALGDGKVSTKTVGEGGAAEHITPVAGVTHPAG